jgi:hypothetical protein
MPAAELVSGIRLAQTRAFIEYRPELVVFTRKTKDDDGAGGFEWIDPVDLSAQRMRLIPTKSSASARVTTNGQTVTPDWMLVGYPDADVKVGDTALVRGHLLEVIFISDVPTDRVIAECWENVDG